MEIAELRPGLWRWTGSHPDWTPAEGGPDGWEPDVASFALVDDAGLVLFDPLVPSGDEERFWRNLDRDVEHHGPPRILLTLYWHARSTQTIAERYPGTEVWTAEAGAEEARQRVAVTTTFSPGQTLVRGVESRPAYEPYEAVFWVPAHGALILGDALLGAPAGGVRVPDAWFPERLTPEAAREALRPLLDLPVELLLVSHGEPVVTAAHEALERALRA